MERQMTIFDYLGEQELENMTEEEMVAEVGARLGLKFTLNPNYHEYICKYKGRTCTVSFDNYNTGDDRQGKRFISAGYETKTGGTSGPRDSVDEAVRWFFKRMEGK